MGKGVQRLDQQLRDAGLSAVTLKLYPDARHEPYNETNRDQITADLLQWLGSALGDA